MFLSISKSSAAYRLASLAWEAITTDEAKELYSEAVAQLAHGCMLTLSWAVWLCDIALDGAVAMARVVRDVVGGAIAGTATPTPLALPWSCEVLGGFVATTASDSTNNTIPWPTATDRVLADAGLIG